MARTYLDVDGIKSPNGLSTKTTSGTTTDGNFSAPVDGMLSVDTSNHKLLYRSGGTWREPPGTGGSSINGWKDAVDAATTGSETYTIASGTVSTISGTTIDGVALAIGQRLLIKNAPATSGVGAANTTQPTNGVYTVTGNTTNLSVVRSPDADANGELILGTRILVTGGTINSGATYRISALGATPWVPGTTTTAWGSFFQEALGSLAAPTYSFAGDSNTGMYSSAPDTLDFVIGGVRQLSLAAGGVSALTTPFNVDPSTGTASATINLVGRNAGAAVAGSIVTSPGSVLQVNAPTAGALALLVTGGTGGFWVTDTQIRSRRAAGANAGSPDFTFDPDTNTGIYSSAADTLNFSTNGTNRLQISNTEVTAAVPLATVTSAGPPSAATSDGSIAVDNTNNALYFRSNSTWRQVSSTNSTGSAGNVAVPVAFTDGDSLRRVTVVDTNATATSNITVSIRRPDSTDPTDRGYIYQANVVSQGAGTFDILVVATEWGTDDPTANPPNETIQVIYNIDAISVIPAGSMEIWPGAAAPAGWLLCQGQETPIASYAALYAVLGTTYGTLTNGSGGAGSTHFRLPDMRGRVAVGVGTATGATGATAHTLGQKAGEEKHLLLAGESGLPVHNHAPSGGGNFMVNSGQSNNATAGASTASPGSLPATTANSTSADAVSQHENMPPYVGLNYIIKT